ncbi:PREDICTED: translation initiation factor eIF-2B subunit delta-like [Amphimedon queenslandica]|uniref:Translation initiation factor eIF2B subunit delta n=1 Tax=Amphimedon queenslandica TaxID=400682 RepID=A0A1X7UMD1_AMPQE|nr:PREDICTED: translation initiation factor eIF-2B subunit delta-like [Amphimedon queenslandica]|eukprot:XP_019853510.1 PREDICTED: translation initiation factor eIF-2B subunit delta-like [Amphimedon queenslandica]
MSSKESEEKSKGSKKDPKTQPQRQKGGKDGGGSAEGSGASAKEAKEAKKKLKAERRAQKKLETGSVGSVPSKTSQTGPVGKTGQTGLTGKTVSGGVSCSESKKDIGGSYNIEQVKSTARAVHLLKEKSISHSEDGRQVPLFSHLHQYERRSDFTTSLSPNLIPPSVVRLAVLYSQGIICGSNARCIAMLGAFKKVIKEYTTPPQKILSRDLEVTLKPYISFLISSRPLSVSMGNAIKWLKLKITKIQPNTPENEAKQELCKDIDEYLQHRVSLADEVISASCCKIIKDHDVILVYAHSSIVVKSLIDAHNKGLKFRVIVVDSRPKLEGQQTLRRLVKEGIPCSYIFFNAVSYIMKEVSKVLLGAHSLLANGYVMSRIGTATISLVAKSYNVPVLVCCETYKFSERVQADAFVSNELGDPNDLVPINRRQGNLLSNWKDLPSLNLLNLTYDVTSPDLVAMVITEEGNLPCTSVPVILRLSQMNIT